MLGGGGRENTILCGQIANYCPLNHQFNCKTMKADILLKYTTVSSILVRRIFCLFCTVLESRRNTHLIYNI